MPETVLVHEMVLGLPGGITRDDGVQCFIVTVCEEDGLDVGILYAHVDHAVVFLVLAGEFVLLDAALGIVVGMGAEHEAELGAAVHGLGIYIVAFLRVLLQPPALLPLLEIDDSAVVDALVVVGQYGIEIDLGLGDVQQGLLPCHILGFLGVQNVIRWRRHLGDDVFRRADRRKGFDLDHILRSIC